VPEPRKPPDALREALAQIAAEDLPELIADARFAARARAKATIEDMLVEELLGAASAGTASSAQPARAPAAEPRAQRRPAAARPSQRGTPRGGEVARRKVTAPERTRGPDAKAWWAYCVIAAAERDAAPVGFPGVEPSGAVELIQEGELVALVSPVPRTEFSDERLREHLNDVEWLERVARAHETVLERALEGATILPLRLCTLYTEREGVIRMLREQEPVLCEALANLERRREWGVKLFVDSERLAEAAAVDPGDAPAGSASSGTAYMARRRRERLVSERARELGDAAAQEIHRHLERIADAARANPPQRPELHGRDQRMLLNGAYLVSREREGEFENAVGSLREEWGTSGFELELTGPWPPYNFVSTSAMVMP
jgi:Gas vesicle synthesis protein GvpL/GvpF